ncbi:hypothetical protein RI129_012223 [Pyrocoelia pectoralis]|uniref:Homologous recombination OB-fold protein OB-fold domain-containing protein n=1 Tax=Pyrocoelia pectoralis TaxID=417401 RepID=A0AAN7ZFQ5_9COLE
MFEDFIDNDIFKVPWDIPCPPPSRKIPSPSKQPKKVKRKFPGPAGLLSNTLQSQSTLNEIPCSQDLAEVCQAPWEQMSKDFRLLNDRGVYLPDKYNIAWIKTKAKDNRLINRKAPFLTGTIHKINTKTSIVTIVLKDPTGQINGTIVNNLYENYQKHLVTGTVITLQQVGVLMTHAGNYYLTITSNNLVSIYNGHSVIRLKNYTVEDFSKNITTVKALHSNNVNRSVNTFQENHIKPPPPQQLYPNHTMLTEEDAEILNSVFEGVDVDSFFDDV